MARRARIVVPRLPHHVTQRGNRRQQVFFDEEDYLFYLKWLGRYSRRRGVSVLAWCLMTNHVHLVLVPNKVIDLQSVLKPLHSKYARRINSRFGWSGHLWQARYFSSAVDSSYLPEVIRYVELNPVRAEMVSEPEDYPWSSSQGRMGLRWDNLIDVGSNWNKFLPNKDGWKKYLTEENILDLEKIRFNTSKNLPSGSEEFLHTLEQEVGIRVRYRRQGRPKR